ncbi:MAG: CARDB domain-containing protein [Patescibacteria group bacterium]
MHLNHKIPLILLFLAFVVIPSSFSRAETFSGSTSLSDRATYQSQSVPVINSTISEISDSADSFNENFNSEIDRTPEQPVDESLFRVIDSIMDRADLPGGKKIFRVYQSHRLLQKIDDGFKVRPPGWNLFHETGATRLKKTDGYSFRSPVDSSVTVESASMEMKNGRGAVLPKSREFRQFADGYKTVSEYQDIYPNVDIRFRDSGSFRQKDIVIRENPGLVAGDRLIFWEEWTFSPGSKVMIGVDIVPDGEREITASTLSVRSPGGLRFSATPPIVYDSAHADSNGIDSHGEGLSQILKVDYKKNRLLIGTRVDADYLNDPELVYPVTIDPTYSECDESKVSNIACAVVDFYVRSDNGSAQTTYNNNDLFLGRWLSAGHNYTRHPVIKFNLDFSKIDGPVSSATLNLYYRNTGNGTATKIDATAKRITASWNDSNPTGYDYGSFRGSATTENPVVSLSNTPTAVWKYLNVTASVKKWQSGTSNYGFLLDQDPAWASGSTPPSGWEDRLLVFDAASASGTTGPYLDIVSAGTPDLTKNSGFIEENTTTFAPGETFNHVLSVKNIGTGASGSFTTNYYLKKDSSGYTDTYKIGSRSFNGIAVEDSQTLTFTYTIPADLTPGAYYLSYWIDAGEVVTESDETNNRWKIALTVTDPLLPNLSKYDDYISPSVLKAGEQLSAQLTIKNIGDVAAKVGTYVNYYFSQDYYNYSNSYLIDDDYFSALSKDGTANETMAYTIPASTPPGKYFFYYWIDGTEYIAESDEGDNRYFLEINVLPASAIDLTADNLSIVNNSAMKSGQNLSAQGIIHNTGNTDSGNFSYSLEIRNTNTGDYYSLTNLSPNTLSVGAGNSNVVTLTGLIPDSCSFPLTGTYDIRLTLDGNDNVPESNNSNNTGYSSNTVVVDRYSYCGTSSGGGGGGGGGGTPLPDYDQDKFVDVEEKFVGTSLVAADTKPLYDIKAYSYLSKATDVKQNNYAADPVNVRTGSFEFTQTDFSLPGRGFPIDFTRTYNSKTQDRANRFGRGWNFSYNQFYYQDPTTKDVQVYNGGALVALFETDDGGQIFRPAPGEYDSFYKENGFFVYKTLSGVKYVFSEVLTNNLGLLEKIIDTNGNATLFSYSIARDLPLLTTVSDASGRSIQLIYGSSEDDLRWDKVAQLRDLANPTAPRVVDYEYDGNGYLIHVKGNRSYAGATDFIDRYFTYDGNGRMLTYTDPRGTVLHNKYDSEGRVIEQSEFNPDRDPVGSPRLIYKLTHEGADPAVSGSTHCALVENYRDATETYSLRSCFNADELKIYERDGEGNVERWSYDGNGSLTAYTDQNGAVTEYQYDAKRRKTRQILPDAGGLHTEISYGYEDGFNRLVQEQIVSGGITKTTGFTIDPANGNILEIIDPLGSKEIFTYDSFGNALTFTDKNNQLTTYAYDVNGNYRAEEKTTVSGADGLDQVILKKFKYDVYGNVIELTTPRGNIFSYEYDTRGNKRKETNPQSGVKIYSYDLEDNLISETDELGRVTTSVYDKNIPASLISVTRADNGESITIQKTYDLVGNLLIETDPLGRTIKYQYDKANRLAEKQTPFNIFTYAYDPAGNPLSETDSAGRKTAYFYNTRRKPIEVRRYLDSTNYVGESQVYDGLSRIVSKVDGNGNATSFEYDLAGRLTKKTDSLSGVTTYFYDKTGNKIGELNPRAQDDGSLRNAGGKSNSSVYDGKNRLLKSTNATDKVSLYFYDADGNSVKTIDRQDSNGGNATRVARTQYDSLGRKTIETDSLGATTKTDYDKVGNVVSKTDEEGRKTVYTYDGWNRLTVETDPAGNATLHTYDKAGNKISLTYPDGKKTLYEYNDQNLLKKVTDAVGKSRSFIYNALGNKTGETNKLGITASFEYDWLGRLVKETNSQNTETIYAYDNNGNRLSITQKDSSANAKSTSFEYDTRNRLTKTVNPGGSTESAIYDKENNVTQTTDGNGQIVAFEYDALNRLNKKTVAEGAILYGYDQWDSVIALTDLVGNTTYSYDSLNRLLTESKTLTELGKTLTITRAYHGDGRLASLRDAAGITIDYAYDNRGLLRSVKKGDLTLATYDYSTLGRPTLLTYGNGVKTNYSYDDLHRIAILEITNAAGTSLFKQDYSYDGESNRVKLVENGARVVDYTYDSLNQLSGVQYTDGAAIQNMSFEYDAFGNRTKSLLPTAETIYSYASASDQLSTLTVNGLSKTDFTYDGNGALTQESDTRLGRSARVKKYNWDSQGRLSKISYENTFQPSYLSATPVVDLSFAYDADGNRVKKTSGGASTYYLNDGLRVLDEMNSTGAVAKTLVSGLEQIAEIDSAGVVTFVHSDILGSTVLLTDQAGAVAQEYEYDVFGSVMGMNGSYQTDYLFTGQQYDPESELYYYNARYYNPRLGRFISRDSFLGRAGDSLSRNRYAYVKNNPLKFTDPTGNVAWGKLGGGIKDLFFGAVTTVFGGVEAVVGGAMVGGAVAGEVATIGGATVPAVVVGGAGVGLAGMGANNVVAGGSQVATGGKNMWDSLWEDEDDVAPSVDYTYNPAHEAIDSLTKEGSTGNSIAHVAYDVIDIFGGGAGATKGLQTLSKLPEAGKATEGIYTFVSKTRKTYCGRACDIPRRIGEHLRSGLLLKKDISTVETFEVLGGVIKQSIAEQLMIKSLGGISKLENKINSIGKARQYLLEGQSLGNLITGSVQSNNLIKALQVGTGVGKIMDNK